MLNEQLRIQVERVVQLLAHEDYKGLEVLTHGERLSASDIATAVSDYGCQLVEPPLEAYQLIDVVAVDDPNAQTWAIAMPMWTREEGRSDLTLELTISQADHGFRIEIDGLHVL